MITYADIPQRFNLATYFLDRNLEEGRGERVAIYTSERAYTFADVSRLANRAGHVLRGLGVERGQRILLALNDGPEFVATWFGAVKIGAVTAEVYTFLQPKDYAYYLNYTRARVIVVDGTTLEKIRSVRHECPFLQHVVVAEIPTGEDHLGSGEVDFASLVSQAQEELDAADTSRDDIALWKFTTGTTGVPKAAVHAHHDPVINFHAYALGVLDLHQDDIVLPVPKLFFGYARDLTALYNFGVGAAGVVFPDRSTPERLFELIARYRPTILVAVPTMLGAMATHPEASRQNLSSLRLCTSAGEALPVEIHSKWMRTFGVEVLDGIGSSELYHIYVSNRLGAVRPGSLGQPVPGYQAKVADPNGQPVPPGEVGELWAAGDSAALMYWDDHEKTERTFRGEWVRTGDLVRQDADGYFWYQGRADDLLKVSGIWVAPVEIEGCLLEHPAVADCAVIGYDEGGFTLLRAYVVVKSRQGTVSLAGDLQEFVRSRLSPHKYPRDVRFLDALPRTPTGKVDRRALKVKP